MKSFRIILLSLVLALALLATPIMAQEGGTSETAETTEATAPGLGTLMLVMGVGAVVIVGGVIWARDNFPGFPGEPE